MTSASTPQVAAAAALLKSAYGTLSGAEVRRVIERTAEKVGPYSYADVPGYPNGSRHNEVGYGRLNVFKALDLGDVMIADWPLDNGVEPSTPPGGNFFTRSDIVIRPSDDDTFDPTSDGSSDIREDMAHTISVRVRNVGPATARGVTVDVRATPWVGLEFVYPDDWVTEDVVHIRPAAIDLAPFTLVNGETAIRRFGLTATQSTALAGWAPRWHPCLVAATRAENDYAFATAPGGASLQMPRNNLAQRNLSVVPIAESLSFPFVIGHPANLEPRLDLIVEAGALAREGEVFLLLGDSSDAFPVAKRAQAFGKGQVKARSIAGGKLTKVDGRPAVQDRRDPCGHRADQAIEGTTRLAARPPSAGAPRRKVHASGFSSACRDAASPAAPRPCSVEGDGPGCDTRPPLTATADSRSCRCPLSRSTLTVLPAGTTNAPSGNVAGASIPLARTTRPAGASVISIAGNGSATSCQLFGGSRSSRRPARLIAWAFVHRPTAADVASQALLNAGATNRSPGYARIVSMPWSTSTSQAAFVSMARPSSLSLWSTEACSESVICASAAWTPKFHTVAATTLVLRKWRATSSRGGSRCHEQDGRQPPVPWHAERTACARHPGRPGTSRESTSAPVSGRRSPGSRRSSSPRSACRRAIRSAAARGTPPGTGRACGPARSDP